MSFFYPQAVMTLRVRWENFDNEGDTILKKDYKLQVLAQRVRVQINDYTKADTFEADIDYKNFPFDPRCIRALGVTVHMEDKKKIFKSNNALNLIVPSPDNTIFQGFADEESMDFDEINRMVRLSGRDFTALLIDAPYDGKAIDLGIPLDTAITQILSGLESVKQLVVDNRTGGDLPTIAKFAPDFSPLGKSRSGKKKEFVWDVIQDLVQRASLIAYIELDKLVITKPRVLYSDITPTKFIYGKNLRTLGLKRKLGRDKGINIVVRSLNLEQKTVIEAKIPEEATAEWANSIGVSRKPQIIQKVDTKGEIKDETAPYIAFNVPNVVSKDQLVEIGQGIYEEMGRQQLEGNLETLDMCSIQDGVEVNLLTLRNGSPVKIEIDQGDLKGLKRLTSESERVRFLKSRCYKDDVARAFARSMGRFATRFYTKSVEYTMDKDEGYSMRLEFINFIELGNKGLRR